MKKGRTVPAALPFSPEVLTDTQLCDYCAVALDILLLKVVEEVPSVTYHLQKPAAGVMILLVDLDVLGKLVDPLGEDSDLYLGRARVLIVLTVSFDNCCFFFFS